MKSTLLLSGLILILLSGCLRTNTDNPGNFVAPAAVPTPTPTPLPPTPTVPGPGNCTDVLSFLDDITLPDGSVVVTGSSLDKRWQVRNNGTCDWGAGYTLRPTSGEPLGVADDQPLPDTAAGSIAVIQIQLTAPDTAGNYRTSWRAYNSSGKPFGDPVYIDIVVQ